MADELNGEAEIRFALGAMPYSTALEVEITDVQKGAVMLEAPLTAALEAPPGSFAASSVGAIGDMAAITSGISELPKGFALSTMDFTVKMLGPATGSRLRAIGRALQIGNSTCVCAADVYILNGEAARLCGTVLATGRRLDLRRMSGGGSE